MEFLSQENKLKYKVAIALTALALTTVACSPVRQDEVGVIVHKYGNDQGPDLETIGTGNHFIPPWQELYRMPTSLQSYVWTASDTEGSRDNEEIVFQDEQGLVIRTDIGINFTVERDRAVDLFARYRNGIETITDTHIRNFVRSAFVEVASTMAIEDIYGSGKTELLEAVEEATRQELALYGVTIESIYWVGEMRIPDAVQDAIEAKVQATQDAIRAENQLRQTQAQAAMDVAQAEGRAEAQIAAARGEAESIRLRGEVLREYPEVLQQDAIQRWDGILPRVTGSEVVPFINVQPND